MSVSILASATDTASAYSNTTSQRVPQKSLGQEDFFKLIAVQLAAQDPLKPMEDTSFIAQMAQFSSLENSSQLVTQFEKFAALQENSSALALLGREVSFADTDGSIVRGTVSAVESKDEGVFITVGGTEYPAGLVQRVGIPAATSDNN
ncbi:flagellar hook capping FlgD N-terminal domain-containing protein [Opitutales bacterium ASA1]|uniref:flagellar hook capping FlgD N-terminal domain-containing protein n=1 Tax=Congregicoccus parvus TaxID=3081749 RepID=UPI002B2AEEC8|nr:flagellar hook capping FlgD N-terminal domain-containing protein [Opitutales bacterium ASA1]